MATLDKPKHGDTGSYRSRNTLWRHRRMDEPPAEPTFRQSKPRDVCKPSPDGSHAFAEYLVGTSFFDWEGNKRIEFVLCCVYCKRRAYYEGIPFDRLVKWITIPKARAAA